jgi:hypothetical protein
MRSHNDHSDAIFYEMAMNEIQSGQMNRGLMAKAIAKSNGDKKSAKILYLEWRVEILQKEAISELEKFEAEEAKNWGNQKQKKDKVLADLKGNDPLSPSAWIILTCIAFFVWWLLYIIFK